MMGFQAVVGSQQWWAPSGICEVASKQCWAPCACVASVQLGSKQWQIPSHGGLPLLMDSRGVTASPGSAPEPTQLAQPGTAL